MAPVAMIAPWPAIRRGLDDMVPTVPGLVREIVVPWKSAGGSLARGGRAARAAEAGAYSWKLSAPEFLILGTIRLRAPSLPGTSMAIPRFTWDRTRRKGWPSRSA